MKPVSVETQLRHVKAEAARLRALLLVRDKQLREMEHIQAREKVLRAEIENWKARFDRLLRLHTGGDDATPK